MLFIDLYTMRPSAHVNNDRLVHRKERIGVVHSVKRFECFIILNEAARDQIFLARSCAVAIPMAAVRRSRPSSKSVRVLPNSWRISSASSFSCAGKRHPECVQEKITKFLA
jgi:hypothetical protein